MQPLILLLERCHHRTTVDFCCSFVLNKGWPITDAFPSLGPLTGPAIIRSSKDANGTILASVFCRDDLQKLSFGHSKLTFILLGAVCFALADARGECRSAVALGLFGIVHGIGEWLGFTALITSDSLQFTIFRTAIMTGLFLFLMEFARRPSPDQPRAEMREGGSGLKKLSLKGCAR
jgi:hypothetical protein